MALYTCIYAFKHYEKHGLICHDSKAVTSNFEILKLGLTIWHHFNLRIILDQQGAPHHYLGRN